VKDVVEEDPSLSAKKASCAGRVVLIKSIAQAVPTYSMSCFLLPINIYKMVRAAVANYWWGSSADNRHLQWMSWERPNQRKSKGSMGFRISGALTLPC
jgi:hypothetical protein